MIRTKLQKFDLILFEFDVIFKLNQTKLYFYFMFGSIDFSKNQTKSHLDYPYIKPCK